MNSKTMEQLNLDIKALETYLKDLENLVSKTEEEVQLLKEEKLSLLKENPLASAEGAAYMLGIHPIQGGYNNA